MQTMLLVLNFTVCWYFVDFSDRFGVKSLSVHLKLSARTHPQSCLCLEKTQINREQMDRTTISQSLGCVRWIMIQLSRSLIALDKVSLERTMALGGYFHPNQSLWSLKCLCFLWQLSTEDPFESAWDDIWCTILQREENVLNPPMTWPVHQRTWFPDIFSTLPQ